MYNTLVYSGFKISAEVKLYDWYNINDKGEFTTSQGELLDKEAMKIVQWNIYDEETGEEYWLDAKEYDFEAVKTFIDKEVGKPYGV